MRCSSVKLHLPWMQTEKEDCRWRWSVAVKDR
jgi:hypothetical protein